MVMNNLNNAMPGVPVDPMAQKQQMQQMQQPNQAVYGNQAIVAKGNQIFGTPEMMQASVAPMEQRQVIDPLTGMPVVNQQQIV